MDDIVTAGPFTWDEARAYVFKMEERIEPEFNSHHYRLLYDGSDPECPVFYIRHKSWE